MGVNDALIINFCIVGDNNFNKFLFICCCVFNCWITEVFKWVQHTTTFQILFLKCSFKIDVFINLCIFLIHKKSLSNAELLYVFFKVIDETIGIVLLGEVIDVYVWFTVTLCSPSIVRI